MTVATAATTAGAPASMSSGAEVKPRRRIGIAWLGLTPFAAYVILFLGIPAGIAIASGFFSNTGSFTFANLAAFANPQIQTAFFNSFYLSVISAVIGAVLGALVCYALMGTRPDGVLRTVIDSASSVLAQFGGVMLAFAFIAVIGSQGIITQWLINTLHVPFNQQTLYTVPGLIIPYVYFQVPLMVLTFMPAMEGLKTTWGEAAATLGGSRWTYWRRIAFPILAPAFFGSLILLFANSFSSFATAAALIDQGGIIPLTIRQQSTSETVVGVSNVSGVLALGMVVVMVVVMVAYSALQRRAARWQR
jgi:putative spermidine/putrescine transport system permease protein